MLFQIGDLRNEIKLLSRYRLALYRSIFQAKPESKEISEGVVCDYDAQGNLVGIDIDNASKKIDLKEVILSKIPAEVESLMA